MINNIRKFEDINLNEKDLKNEYYYDILNSKVDLAEEIIKNNQLESKILDDDNLNSLISNLLNLEKNVENETKYKLLSLNEEYKNIISRLKYCGEYNSETLYFLNNLIIYQGEIYFCIKENKNINPTNTKCWIKLGLKGYPSYPSLGVKNKGYWSSLATYNKFDMIVYKNQLFVSKVDNNINKIPSNNLDSWCLVSQIQNSKIEVNRNEPVGMEEKGIWFQIV